MSNNDPLAPRKRHRPGNVRLADAGVSLIEVLVAILVLAIGVLGLGGLQARALKNNQSAFERSQAVMLSYYMLDAMRANVMDARNGNYNMTKQCTSPAAGTSLAERDRKAWIDALKETLGNRTTTCGKVSCTVDFCAITVYWDDVRGTGGSETHEVLTESRL